MCLSGFFFLLILILQIAMAAFGYILEPTPKHYESDYKLQSFNNNPKKFKIGVSIALIEHFCVITLAITLFFVISQYNIVLGIFIIIFRLAEGSIQVYIEKGYWELRNIAERYSNTIGAERDLLMDSYRNVLQTKSHRFAIAMIGWVIGTTSFSIGLIIYALAPPFVGWLGIVASIIVGVSNAIKLIEPNIKVYETLSSIGGLLAIGFEVLIGGWLLFF